MRARIMSMLKVMKRSLAAVVPEQRYTVLLIPDSNELPVGRFAFRVSTAVGAVRVLAASAGLLVVALSTLLGVLLISDSPERLRAEQQALEAELAALRPVIDEVEDARTRLRAEVGRVGKLVYNDRAGSSMGVGPLSELDLRSALAESLPQSLPEVGYGERSNRRSALRSLADRPFDVVVDDGPFRLREERDPSEFAARAPSRGPALAAPRGAPVDAWVSSPFGFRRATAGGERELHSGLDLAAEHGAPVRSTAPGVVIYAGNLGDLGRLVAVDHGHGTVTRYGHLSRINVAVGQELERGSVIGEVGSTGLSSGPHLHYELLHDGLPVDPMVSFEESVPGGIGG